MIGGTKTPGQVQSLLAKSTIPLTMVVRLLWLDQRPSAKQLAGAVLILAGAGFSIISAWASEGEEVRRWPVSMLVHSAHLNKWHRAIA